MYCTGQRCPIQYRKVNPATCTAYKSCPWVTRPATIGDFIRCMDDETLAMTFRRFGLAASKNGPKTEEEILKWLKQEAEL